MGGTESGTRQSFVLQAGVSSGSASCVRIVVPQKQTTPIPEMTNRLGRTGCDHRGVGGCYTVTRCKITRTGWGRESSVEHHTWDSGAKWSSLPGSCHVKVI